MALSILAATLLVTTLRPLQGGGGYVPIVEHQGPDTPPAPVPPTYPPANPPPIPNSQQSSTYVYDFALGSQGNFPELSANYELKVEVVVAKVNGVVTQTRALLPTEVVKGQLLNKSIRVAATDPQYGNVRHGKLSLLKFIDMSGTPVQLTVKRVFPIDLSNQTYKVDFIVP